MQSYNRQTRVCRKQVRGGRTHTYTERGRERERLTSDYKDTPQTRLLEPRTRPRSFSRQVITGPRPSSLVWILRTPSRGRLSPLVVNELGTKHGRERSLLVWRCSASHSSPLFIVFFFSTFISAARAVSSLERPQSAACRAASLSAGMFSP